MSSLARHLLADDHDALAFRADCARCRSRLNGSLPEPHLLSTRQQATLATGLVAAGSLLPAAAAATKDEPADGHDGPPVVLKRPADRPELAQPTGSERPAESPQRSPSAGDRPEPPPVAVLEPHGKAERRYQPPRPSPPRRGLAQAPSSDAPTLAPSHRLGDENVAKRGGHSQEPQRPLARSQAPQRAPSAPRHSSSHAPPAERASAAPQRATAAQQSSAAALPAAAASSGEASAAAHTVRPGESLWAIAARRLGPSASDGEVAAYVQRLWETNADRIATGTPNLIYPGQKLRLP